MQRSVMSVVAWRLHWVTYLNLSNADLTKVLYVVAWRLHWVTYLNRLTPEAPCTEALTTLEWQARYLHFQKTTVFPAPPPTMRQAVHWIARLGGFLDRKSDGEPGMTVLWRGWQRLQDLATLWETVGQAPPKLVGYR